MSIEAQELLELLPAIHRIRDAEVAERAGLERGPLQDLMTIIAEQMALMEENIEQSYDDLFIETCVDWLTPYIGDVIGYQSLHGKVPNVASPRAEVAHTIALRRRKGTAVVLEQLARDVTEIVPLSQSALSQQLARLTISMRLSSSRTWVGPST